MIKDSRADLKTLREVYSFNINEVEEYAPTLRYLCRRWSSMGGIEYHMNKNKEIVCEIICTNRTKLHRFFNKDVINLIIGETHTKLQYLNNLLYAKNKLGISPKLKEIADFCMEVEYEELRKNTYLNDDTLCKFTHDETPSLYYFSGKPKEGDNDEY